MKKNLLLLALLLIFSGCETQVGTAITSTFSNIVTGKAFRDSSSDKAYEALKQTTLSRPSVDSVTPNCIPTDALTALSLSDEDNMTSIKDQLCTCTAWGTCDVKSCSCDKLCPNSFGIFKKVNEGEWDSAANTLSFTNGDNKFVDNDPSYSGYCWGFSVLTQRFNRLATFSPATEKKYQSIEEESSRIQEYKRIIAQLNRNEPVTIPGFKSLQEFSTDPEVKNLLEDSVKEIWAANATGTQGLAMVTSTKTPDSKKLNDLFDDIEFRLKNNLSPSIVYNEPSGFATAHVLQVSSTSVNEAGERYLCLRDNQYRALNSQNCNIKMIMRNDGKLIRQYGTYDPAKPDDNKPRELGNIALTHTENTDTMEQMHNLHNKCAGEKGCEKSELK